jgi:hypothetical protein
MFQVHVSSISADFGRILQVFIWMLHILQMTMLSVCSKCFICLRRMLQLFHLCVAKVNLDVGVKEA